MKIGIQGARGHLGQATSKCVNIAVNVQLSFAAGDFNLTSGDGLRLSGRAPQSLKAAIAAAFAA